MTNEVAIIATGGANLASLGFALQRLGANAIVTEDPDAVQAAGRVILPGVGAARDAMHRLAGNGLDRIIPALTQPVLGICLGMQLLFSHSEEDETDCLGVIPGTACRFPQSSTLPVPQMGWNQIRVVRDSPLLTGVVDGDYAYFIHSYAVPETPATCAIAEYGVPFSAVVAQDNFFGTQFHPERSSRLGARILANFLGLPQACS
jgi:glutamine amidotransferase